MRSANLRSAILVSVALAYGALAQTFTGVSIGAPVVGGGGGGSSANIDAAFDCRSFGQTATATEGTPGSLNIKYATPIMCWAAASTVGGTQVNDGSWVPEVFFSWDWDDTSLGSVTRGGLSMDLGKSVGLVAAHAFKPSTYAETCNGGTNSSHTVTLTVSALVGGVRESDSATLTVCVENPATTWPTPVAFCDDADCSNDAGVPAGTVHGGNGTNLATILDYCDANGTERVVLEGGVTFTTATANNRVGVTSCLIESYGTGQAKLKFTGASGIGTYLIDADSANCAGYRLHNVEFAGNSTGTGQTLFGADDGTGCLLVLDSDLSNTVGDGLYMVTNTLSNADYHAELYFIKFRADYQTPGVTNTTLAFAQAKWQAWVGGEMRGLATTAGSHNLRMPHWEYAVVDAMWFDDHRDTGHLLTMRMQCGGTTCTDYPGTTAKVAAVTRNEFRASDIVTVPTQLCYSGSGAGQATKCYDVDYIANLYSRDTDAQTSFNDFMEIHDDATAPLSEKKRLRWIGNIFDLSSVTSSPRMMVSMSSQASDCVWIGNVGVASSGNGDLRIATSPCDNPGDTVKNNVIYEAGTGNGDIFNTAFTESADNQIETSDPFDRDGDAPASEDLFMWAEVGITSSNTALKGQGVVTAVPTDLLDGDSIPQSSDYDAGVDDE